MRAWPSFLPLLLSVACGAVFPEVSTIVKSPPAGKELVPPPPADLLFIAFAGAEIPSRTRDGLQWDSIGGTAPDPFASLVVDDHELFRTPVQANTLKPTWPDQKRVNYRIPPGARVRVEVWDSNALNNHPICRQEVRGIHEEAGPVPLDIVCDSGARVRLRVEPAHARWGLGLSYELRTVGAAVSRVLKESPAARAGLVRGQEIREIQGKPVAGMAAGEVQSLLNSNAQAGVDLLLRDVDRTERRISVKEGVIYPSADEGISIE